ncbi:hypothetical protein [Halopiger goleimassiliensis]|uniref:hypothetical protein n=1 Tax=Halopiger goleimassiliensis TaxID=1293048 RepID=UPI000677F7BA|nr:hypothetical protein [Halopiger goleimassiliensis]
MAPALVHFLVGAALALVVGLPFVLRSGRQQHALWVVVSGGIWGMLPDVHRVTPLFADLLSVLHDSRWGNVFAAHYTLDRPPFDNRPLGSIAGAVLTFVLAVGLFSLAGSVGGGDRPSSAADGTDRRLVARVLVAGYAATVAGLVAGLALAAVVGTATVESLGILAGWDSAGAGVVVLGIACVAGGTVFAAFLEAIEPVDRRLAPHWGGVLGAVFGIVCWGIGVALALPVVLAAIADLPRPIPYLHRPGFVALLAYGFVLGWSYPVVRGFVEPGTYDP